MDSLTTVATAAPLAAGWAVHGWWTGRRLRKARRDPLTGLMLREEFTRRARRLLASRPCLVLLADVDDFKQINDQHGHHVGDAVLARVAVALNAAVGAGVAARLGGDEFAAVVPDPGPGDREVLLHTVYTELTCGTGLLVDVSVGAAATSDRPGDGLPDLLRRADEAMYTAKRSNNCHGFAPADATPAAPVRGRRPGRRGATRKEQP